MSKRRCCPKGQTLCLLGSAGALGGWNQAAPVLLRRCPENGVSASELDLRGEAFPVAYKYGVYDTERNAFVRYEEGENRMLTEAARDGRTGDRQRRVRAPAVDAVARRGRGHSGFQPAQRKKFWRGRIFGFAAAGGLGAPRRA